jgi:DNA (cytosine-5)-methyltransferase 1
MKIKGLSLFANVGIGELLLDKTDVEVVVANELLPERAKFYQEVHKDSKMICGDITNQQVYDSVIKESKDRKVNLIIATPPCQGMSMAGKMDPHDLRNTLIFKVADAIDDLDPDYVLIENVPQMLKTYLVIDGKTVLIRDYLEKTFSPKYNISFNVVDAADYGTPQYRKRTIVLMVKKALGHWELPKKQKQITVEDVIGDLPSLEAGEKSKIKHHEAKPHNDRHIEWMKHTPTGETAHNNKVHYPQKDGRRIKGFMTTYKRMSWDKPAPTVTMANGSVSSQNNVHPGRLKKDGTYSDARVLTILEIMKISGIPTSWPIPKWASDNLIRHVIGEMVPPKLIFNIMKNIPQKKKKS